MFTEKAGEKTGDGFTDARLTSRLDSQVTLCVKPHGSIAEIR